MDNKCQICEFASGYSLYEHFRADGCKQAGTRLLGVAYIDIEEFDSVIQEHEKDKFAADYFSFEPTIK